jgi:hypothetical protein
MTKKDFVAIQTALADMRGAVIASTGCDQPNVVRMNQVIDSACKEVANVLALQSGKFKRAEFLKGCGVVKVF